MRKILLIISILFFSLNSCVIQDGFDLLPPGNYRATIDMQGKKLPFNFEVICTKTHCQTFNIIIKNAEEKIEVNDIEQKGDSIILKMPLYNSEIRAKVSKGILDGWFIDYNKKEPYKLLFHADYGLQYRFYNEIEQNPINIAGKWEVFFENDSSKAIGIFKQNGNIITGTFATETGDLRYLEGMVVRNEMYLSCFDGTHTYLFNATYNNNALNGIFYYNKTKNTKWQAKRNEKAELRSAFSLTKIKNESQFTLNKNEVLGKNINLDNQDYKNKIIVLQILGSWCPNCIDESKYINEIYNKNNNVKYVGIAFERNEDTIKSNTALLKTIHNLNLKYPIINSGKTSKDVLSFFPSLENFMSFPTTLYLDKNHIIRYIHTGYYGPATGEYFEKFKAEHSNILKNLEKETF